MSRLCSYFAFFLLLLLGSFVDVARTCTCFAVTKGASADNTNLATYAADSHTLFGYLQHWPAEVHEEGAKRQIYDWDSKVYLGEIPEANVTYNVIGNVNEYGLTITESTWGGIPELAHQDGAIVDYGSLIYIALQRSKSAQEAVHVMTTLVQEYGYASEGESFTIADVDEVWVMEMIGKGNYEQGAVYVAVKIPDGFVTGHANQARIRFLTPDMIYSPDVISFARKIGRFPQDASDDLFSFSDVYNPVTFETARGCEARVWDFFSRVTVNSTDPEMDMSRYTDYVMGYNLTNRMALYYKPDHKLTVTEVLGYMRSHFEGTVLEFDADMGAGAYGLPYRWRPLTWQASTGDDFYFNERSAATQQTGFNMLAQLRKDVPDPIKALLFFGVDDTGSSVTTPFYGGVSQVPKAYAEGDIMRFSFDSAFWVFNLVANFAYGRYSLIYPEIEQRQKELEAAHLQFVEETDKAFLETWPQNDDQNGSSQLEEEEQKDKALALINEACVQNAQDLVATWLKFFQELFVKYMDGNVKTMNPHDPAQLLPTVTQPGYPLEWRNRIVEETGDRYKVPPVATPEAKDEMAASIVELQKKKMNEQQNRRQRWKGI